MSTDFDLTRYTNSLLIQNKTNSTEEIITVNTEFIQFSNTLIDVSSLEETSVLDISNIVQHDTFEKIGGGNTNGFITFNGKYVFKQEYSPFNDPHWYRVDLETNEKIIVDADANGTPSTGDSQQVLAASADGRYALFKLDEYGTTDLVPGDGYSPGPLYRKDLLTGEIVRVDSLSDGSTFSSNWELWMMQPYLLMAMLLSSDLMIVVLKETQFLEVKIIFIIKI